ncbi:MAG: 3-hydroxyacyl-CoA dehydrogenase NAD-binding domain-containing protein, partial [Xanthomarina gelatinilytica]|nr:3-hydroxyacyl-CoA dehydrogenase NAD-binding domain-containing protein [Xanthomarina gelatinilytica]
MKNVAVIGAGTMGNGIAHTFAQSGFKVQLIDI